MAMSRHEQQLFDTVAARDLVRPSVRAVIMSTDDKRLLVQRPSDGPPGRGYAFIGGEYEYGDTFETRLAREIEEETTARIASSRFLFTVENRFCAVEHRIHGLEHYWLVRLVDEQVESRELHLVQEWLPIAGLADVELRPLAVRDLIVRGGLDDTDHLLVDRWPSVDR